MDEQISIKKILIYSHFIDGNYLTYLLCNKKNIVNYRNPTYFNLCHFFSISILVMKCNKEKSVGVKKTNHRLYILGQNLNRKMDGFIQEFNIIVCFIHVC